MSELNSINPFASNNLVSGYPYQAVQTQAPFQLDNNLEAEIQLRVNSFSERRAPVLRRQIFRVQGPAGRVHQVIRRLQTPQPDIIEKVIVTKPQRDVINLLIERPVTSPTIKEKLKEVKPQKTSIIQQIVRVAPRTLQPVQPADIQHSAFQSVASYPAYYGEPTQSGYYGY